MITRERFYMDEIGFLTKLINEIILKHPETKKEIHKKLKKRIERNRKIEKELDENPDPFLQFAKKINKKLHYDE